MELSTMKIHMARQIGRAESQITLDDDYNVPDYRPDIVKIIRQQGIIKLEETKAVSGAVFLKGKLIFKVLYRSDQENGKISCLKGELPFSEKINMDGISEYDPVRVNGEVEDLTIGVIHSRKLNVRAVLILRAVMERAAMGEATLSVGDEKEVMQLQKPIEISELVFAKHDLCRQKNEIILPSSKPNIREILWKSIELRNVGSKVDSEGIHLNGEVLVSVLYQEEEEADRIQWYETTVPLSCTTELDMAHLADEGNVFYQIQLEDVGKELEVKPDYDGEERMLVLDLQMHMYIRIWQETDIKLLSDVYSLKKELQPEEEQLALEHMLMRNEAVCKLSETMGLMENQEKILQICSVEGKTRIDNVKLMPEGAFVEGTLSVNLLYITTDDQMPVGSVEKIYPFEQLIELPVSNEVLQPEWNCDLLQLSASMTDQNHAEIKAAIGITVLLFEKQEQKQIFAVKEYEMDSEKLQKLPGLTGYIVGKNDTLWGIAKEHHTTIDAIMQANQKKEESLKVGEKLLIIKQV